MLVLGRLCKDPSEGASRARQRLASGAAWDLFLKNVELQGGDVRVLLHPETGPRAQIIRPVIAGSEGTVARIDAYKIGIGAVVLGAGRSRKEDRVLPGVGFTLLREPGERVLRGDELCLVHGEEENRVSEAAGLARSAYEMGEQGAARVSRVLEEMVSA
jgi:pyrimidine-nucleoside phosphorylase